MWNKLKGVIASLLLGVNTAIFGGLILLLVPFKFVFPVASWKRAVGVLATKFAETWIGINRVYFNLLFHPEMEYINFPDNLSPKDNYLVISNHQSWLDILMLQIAFNRKIPHLRFFTKQQLIFIPIFGQSLWALDYPFMKRYSKEKLAKHPELRNKDLEITRKACEKFSKIPVSVLNFVEGTRFTPEKHKKQGSSYRNLLKPKAGGVALVLEAIGERLKEILDVTIVYDTPRNSLWDFFTGRVKKITIHVRKREITPELIHNGYLQKTEGREQFIQWINSLWEEKDELIEQLKSESASGT